MVIASYLYWTFVAVHLCALKCERNLVAEYLAT